MDPMWIIWPAIIECKCIGGKNGRKKSQERRHKKNEGKNLITGKSKKNRHEQLSRKVFPILFISM